MSYLQRTVVVAAPAVGQTTLLWEMHKGSRLHGISLQRLTPAVGGSTATWSLGDAANPVRYLNAITAAGAVGDLVDGLLLNYLYVVLDTIQLLYTPGGAPGATAAVCAVLLEIEQIWPKYA